MRKCLALILLIVNCSLLLHTINASNLTSNLLSSTTRDTLYVFKGKSITIHSKNKGTHKWSNGELGDSITVNPTVNTTYSVSTTQTNLLINGDFEQGNVGFSSKYSYNTPAVNSLWYASTYTVDNNPYFNHIGFTACGDHTKGNGKMMILNASDIPNVSVYSQKVSVSPNSTYEFSCWLSSVSPTNPASLQFSINNKLIGSTFVASSTVCNWNVFYVVWDSGSSTNVDVNIVNQNTALSGNDFALDDIQFANTNVEEFVVIVKDKIQASFSYSSSCDKEQISFVDESLPSGSITNWSWNFGDGNVSTQRNPIHLYSTPGDYNVELTIKNSIAGLTDTKIVPVKVLPVMDLKINQDSVFCCGDSILVQAVGAKTYNWSNGTTGDRIYVSKPGKYFVTGSLDNGCSKSLNFEAKSNPIISIKGESTFCHSESVVLRATGGATYLWSNGSYADSIIVSKESRVWLVGKSTFGCVSDTVYKSITQEPDWTLNIEGEHIICNNEDVRLTGSGADQYIWNTGERTSSIAASTPGVYTLTGINKRGCEKTKTFNVIKDIVPNTNFDVSDVTISSKYNELTCFVPLMNDVVYSWEMGDGTTEFGNNITHKYNNLNAALGFTITLTASTKNNCVYKESREIDVVPFIPNVFTPNDDGVNDLFMPEVSLEVFDRYGIKLYSGTTGWDGSYKGKKVDSDTYFYLISYFDKSHRVVNKKGSVTLIR